MSERAFERVTTLVLLGLGLWYLVQMLSYGGGAGRIPAIVAVVMIGAALVQLALSFRRRESLSPSGAHEAAPVSPAAQPLVEPDTYDSLIRIRGTRRRRFIAIAVWAVLFYIGSLAVGFVLTFPVLFAALLVFVREKLFLTLVVTAVTAVAVYVFVTVFLDLPAFRGFLLD